MISILRGRLTDAVVLECGGIGYYINIPSSIIDELPEPGQEATLYIQMMKSKTDVLLVGFLDEQQRICFRLLSTVSGCGIKSSFAILNAVPPQQLYHYVANKDDAAISKVKGVGKKLSQRIVLELSDKIKSLVMGEGKDAMPAVKDDHAQMAVDALIALGFKRKEAETAVAKVDCSLPVEQVISAALRMYAG